MEPPNKLRPSFSLQSEAVPHRHRFHELRGTSRLLARRENRCWKTVPNGLHRPLSACLKVGRLGSTLDLVDWCMLVDWVDTANGKGSAVVESLEAQDCTQWFASWSLELVIELRDRT